MSTPVLSTKLYIPPLRPNHISRPRLIKRLNQGVQLTPGLTLISAPAGFGKTMLVSEWVYFWFQLVIDIFLVIHLGLHLLFRNHPANAFANVFSMGLIVGMALLGLIHAGLLLGSVVIQ